MRARPRLIALALATLVLAFAVELAPHLVHHLDARDGVHPECPFATALERQHGSPPAAAETAPLLTATPLVGPAAPGTPPARPAPGVEARAPPTLA